MYIWKLARVNVVTVMHDTLRSVVVVAATESQARAVAATVAGDEGQNIWLAGNGVSVVAIGDAHPDAFPYPGVVCADFLEG